MLTAILFLALAQAPGGQPAPAWHWTKNPDGSVGYVWGTKDAQGFVHSLMLTKRARPGKPDSRDAPISYGVERSKFEHSPAAGDEWFGGNAPAVPHRVSGATGHPMKRVHLTFVGPENERRAARSDLEKSPGFQALAASLGDGLAVQDYDPADPMIAELKLADRGNPDVIVQNETGKVRFRAHDYPGADRLTAEIRKADPKYDPAKDPDGGMKLPLEDWLKDMPAGEESGILIVLGCVVLVVVLKK